MRVSFDTNVLVYANDASSGERHDFSKELLARAANADCVIATQSLAEFYSAVTRKRVMHAAFAAASVERLIGLYPTCAADAGCVREGAAASRKHGLAFWDAVLLATVRKAGCRLLITEDFQDGRQFEGVTFLNPFLAENAALLDAALPPLYQS